MSVLSINLKQFYQRRAMWVVYLFVTAMSLGLGAAFFDHMPVEFGRGVFVLPAIWMYLGYLSSTGLPFVIAMICFVMSQMAASVAGGCALLRTEGRKQRFEMAMAGSLVTQGLATAIYLGMILLSYGLALFLPTMPLGGHSFQFHALPWWVLMLPWGIMPALTGVGLLFPKQSVWLLGASAGAMFPCLIILTKNNYLPDLNAPSLVLYALLVCLSWCVLLACTHWHCFKRDLG
ncbi:MAG: hypothetical protein GY809_19220 [Planctomycetes bacterium]|nr:hypothetical protein [Planctomycetota bacterium]